MHTHSLFSVMLRRFSAAGIGSIGVTRRIRRAAHPMS